MQIVPSTSEDCSNQFRRTDKKSPAHSKCSASHSMVTIQLQRRASRYGCKRLRGNSWGDRNGPYLDILVSKPQSARCYPWASGVIGTQDVSVLLLTAACESILSQKSKTKKKKLIVEGKSTQNKCIKWNCPCYLTSINSLIDFLQICSMYIIYVKHCFYFSKNPSIIYNSILSI